ncbi:hypothetical protein [Moorena sp. SIO3H5]|nr:hypothetical protein [Moorena sp. SIO3H5]NEO73144.1 hypothetical protein [Moorena sp. SIO3H5]
MVITNCMLPKPTLPDIAFKGVYDEKQKHLPKMSVFPVKSAIADKVGWAN